MSHILKLWLGPKIWIKTNLWIHLRGVCLFRNLLLRHQIHQKNFIHRNLIKKS